MNSNYDEALGYLGDASQFANGSDVDAKAAIGQGFAILALVDAIENLGYLMYGEE